MSMRNLAAVTMLALMAGCVAPSEPPPPPPPPAPPPPPPPAPPPAKWDEAPLSPGTWAYASDATGSAATFGRSGTAADLMLRCDLASRTLSFSWAGAMLAGGNRATITTTSGVASYSAMGVPGVPTGRVGVGLAARDPFLDKIAYSRGRFMIRFSVASGVEQALIMPVWPEIARAIEDCRK